jgi:hypothetical protein
MLAQAVAAAAAWLCLRQKVCHGSCLAMFQHAACIVHGGQPWYSQNQLHNTDHKVAEGIYVQELLQDGEASFLLQRAVAPQ